MADRWAPGRRLENGYGPTECTVTVLRTRVEAGEPVTIGLPVDGHRAWVLDDRLEEVPHGEPGELCIGGVGLARGYLSRPELTAERFPEHPRLGRIYRTGDLVRFDPATGHHYLGRIDQQVKIRGHRVELGAVESALASLPGVREAVCRLQASPHGARAGGVRHGRRRRAAPAMGRPRAAAEGDGRRAHGAGAVRGPRGAAEAPEREARSEVAPRHRGAVARDGGDVVAPRTDVERLVSEAFGAALGLPGTVSVAADFFLDLGGTSVGAAQVISRLRRHPETSALTVRDLYQARTAAALASRAAAAAPSHAGSAAPRRPAADTRCS